MFARPGMAGETLVAELKPAFVALRMQPGVVKSTSLLASQHMALQLEGTPDRGVSVTGVAEVVLGTQRSRRAEVRVSACQDFQDEWHEADGFFIKRNVTNENDRGCK